MKFRRPTRTRKPKSAQSRRASAKFILLPPLTDDRSTGTMNRPSIKLPPLSSVATNHTSHMTPRGRSGSIVKMEEVGDHSTEETLDQSAYVNINASWVNAKGEQRCTVLLVESDD